MIDQEMLAKIMADQGLNAPSSPEEFDKPFADLGLDSLDIFGVLSEVETAVARMVTDEDFRKMSTLNDIILFAKI